ncbi:MAG: 50S ribosomal protein L9 [Proteobacteria bacterium]|nr:50S ribosomal protein L9 [Pseudomonadota bacterium]
MQIILLERVGKLGKIGDVVTVKDGYARNYLLPAKKALRATAANKKYFEEQRQQIEERNKKQIVEAEKLAKTAVNVKVVLLRQAGESGQLYGSVTARDIAASLRKAGIQVRRGNIVMEIPIKEIGISRVKVSLHAEVIIEVDVNVARSAEEAEAQVIAVEKLFETKELAEAAEEALLEQEPDEQEAGDEAAEEPKEEPSKEMVAAAAEEKPAEKPAEGKGKAANKDKAQKESSAKKSKTEAKKKDK